MTILTSPLKRNSIALIITTWLVMIAFWGCSPLKRTTDSSYMSTDTIRVKSDSLKDAQTVENQIKYTDLTNLFTYPYDWISYRGKAEYTFEGNEGTISIFFVNRIDSIIYVNLNLSGIEIVRVTITPQELVYVNKLNKTYYQGGFFLIEKLLKLPLDFYTIQAVFNGKDIPGYDTLFAISAQDSIMVLENQNRRSLDRGRPIAQKMILDQALNLIANDILFNADNRKIALQYNTYTTDPSGFSFFDNLTFQTEELELDLKLKNVRFNTPGPTSNKIPSSFTPLIFQPKP